MNKIEAYFRYAMWKLGWWLEVKKIDGQWRPRGKVLKSGKVKLFATWCPYWLKSLIEKLRGYDYSHRSDFTDPINGLLHSGKGWSKRAFDKFLENISEKPPLLGKEEIRQIIFDYEEKLGRELYGDEEWQIVAQAQREADIKHYEGG